MLYASSPIGGPPSQKRAAVRFRGKLGFLQGHLRETASAEDFHPAGLLRTDSRAEGPPSSPRRKRRVDLSQTLSLACFLVFRVPNHPHESLSLPLLHFSIRQQVCSRISGPPALAKAGTATYVQNLVAMVHLPLVFSAWCLPAGLLYGIGGIAELPESSREVCAPSHALSYPLWLSFLHVVCGSHFLGPCHCHGHAWLVSSSQRGGSSASRPGCLLREVAACPGAPPVSPRPSPGSGGSRLRLRGMLPRSYCWATPQFGRGHTYAFEPGFLRRVATSRPVHPPT